MNYYYNDNVSHNMNCINFLNKIQSERRMSELWNVINQKQYEHKSETNA